MNKQWRACLHRINDDIASAVDKGVVSGRPFVGFADEAASVFAGIETVLEVIQVNELRRDHEDDAKDLMSDYEISSLLNLVKTTSTVMQRRAGDLADWAADRMREKKR